MPPTVTAIYAGLLALWIVYLAMRIGSLRRSRQISIGDGGDAELARACRAHGNAVETIPLALVLMTLAETLGAPAIALHPLGLLLLAGRVIHGLYFMRGATELRLRFVGMLLTVIVIVLLAIGLVLHSLLGVAGPA